MTPPPRPAAAAAAEKLGRQPGTEIARQSADGARALIAKIEGEIAKQLPPQIPVAYFSRAVLTGLRKSPQLARLAKSAHGKASIYAALLESARFGLVPFTEEAAIVVYGRGADAEAVFIPQWKGMVKVMHNSGQVAAVVAHLICRHDRWRLAYGTGQAAEFVHEPYLVKDDGTPTTAEERGDPIYAYCYVRLRDGSCTDVTMLSRWEAEDIRDRFSRSYQNAEKSWNGEPPKRNSTWHTDFPAMWRKSAIRRSFATAPSSPALADLLLAAARDDSQRPDAAEPPPLSDFDVAEDVLEGETVWDSDDDGQDQEGTQGTVTNLDRPAAMRELGALWRRCGIGGKTDTAVRHAVASVYARDDKTAPPVSFGDYKALTDDQLVRVIAALAALAEDARRKPEDIAAALRQLADEATRQQQPAGAPAG